MKRTVTRVLVLLFLTAAAKGADPWQSKPFQTWTAQECRRLLRDSPWARTYNTQFTAMRPVNRLPGMGSLPGSGEGVSDLGVTYYVTFRSAIPVRQALVRQAQIEAKYNTLDDVQKKALDEKFKPLLDAAFSDKIVVHVVYGSNIAEWDRQLAYYWRSQTLATLKGTVYLSGPDGDRIEPGDYWVGAGDSRDLEFTFPRHPEVAAQNPNKPLVFEFSAGGRVYLRYATSLMKYGGAITY